VTAAHLLHFLLRNNRGTVLAMALAGALAGLSSAAVLAVIHRALQGEPGVTALLAAGFAVLMLGKIGTSFLAQVLLVRFSQQTVLDLSVRLAERILAAPLRSLETRGRGRLLSTLTDDVSALTWAVQVLPQLAMNAAVVVGCSLWLAWLAPALFAMAAVAAVGGAWGYALLNRRAFGVIHAAREARSRLFERFADLTSGMKELMMHRARREEFLHREVQGAAEEYRRHNLQAALHYAVADGWTQLMFYGLIGLLLFAVPALARPSPEALTGYVLAMLYMLGPVWSVIGAVPTIARGQVALAQIEDLGLALETAASPAPASAPLQPGAVQLTGIRFSYPSTEADHAGFTLGPLDFSLSAGELVFVVGGNGSGKSTFVKVLTGLYPPDAGEISVGGVRIDSARQVAYRELYAVVFADFHLFRGLLGLPGGEVASRAREYLQRLELADKVALTPEGFSTLDLSQGQRKRLALVTAWLEDRPCYVFDEWAADQDPEYKAIFYEQLLPELRARGKAVVVVTHDDRWFHLGDRVVKLEDGHAVATWRGSRTAAASARS
jgi:putative ATP-binding cassette transporter